MLLESLLPQLPTDLATIFIYVGAYVGIIFLVYSVFIEQEHRQDLIRLLGSSGLLIYAIYIQNTIFIIAMGAVAVATLIEFIEILLGLHTHSQEDLKRYKNMWRIKK